MTQENVFCSFNKNHRLYKIWLAGANWKEFIRIMELDDITVIQIPLICQLVQNLMKKEQQKNVKQKNAVVSFVELSYITIGIVYVFEYQVKFLHDQVLQSLVLQSKWELELEKQLIPSSRDNPEVLSDKKKTLKRHGVVSNRQQKSKKQKLSVKEVTFDWHVDLINEEELQDVEMEKAMQSLQTSNYNDITIREIEEEPEPCIQMSQFEAVAQLSMQNYQEIRKLVIGRPTRKDGIQNNHDFNTRHDFDQIDVPNQQNISEEEHLSDAVINQYADEGEHSADAINQQDADEDDQSVAMLHHSDNSLPYISMYQAELNDETASCGVDETAKNSKIHNIPEVMVNGHLEDEVMVNDHHADEVMVIDHHTDEVMVNGRHADEAMVNGHSADEVIVNGHHTDEVMENDHHVDDPMQDIPQRKRKYSRRKRKRQFKDIVLQVKLNQNYKTLMRCLSSKLDVISKTDLVGISDSYLFIKPTHMFKNHLKFRHLKEIAFSEKLLMGMNRGKLMKPTEETEHDMFEKWFNDSVGCSNKPNEPLIQPQIEQLVPIYDQDHSDSNVCRNDITDFAHDGSVHMEPCCDEINFIDPVPVAPNETVIEPDPLPLIPNMEPPDHLDLPMEILRVLNFSETARLSHKRSSTDSQKIFMINNQKNREEWGAKGVMQHLFWLWNNNIYPIGMRELMQSNKKKVAAALAFFSVMELNSPRVGLVMIEKKPNSNSVYNIAKSQKLIDLLQDIN